MGAHKADAGGVEQQTDGHASFVTCGPAHSSFHCVYSYVSEKVRKLKVTSENIFEKNTSAQLIPDERSVLRADENKQTHSYKLL